MDWWSVFGPNPAVGCYTVVSSIIMAVPPFLVVCNCLCSTKQRLLRLDPCLPALYILLYQLKLRVRSHWTTVKAKLFAMFTFNIATRKGWLKAILEAKGNIVLKVKVQNHVSDTMFSYNNRNQGNRIGKPTLTQTEVMSADVEIVSEQWQWWARSQNSVRILIPLQQLPVTVPNCQWKFHPVRRRFLLLLCVMGSLA